MCKNFRLDFRSESPNKRTTSILAVLRFENLSEEMFFDLISSVVFEKRLSFVFIDLIPKWRPINCLIECWRFVLIIHTWRDTTSI